MYYQVLFPQLAIGAVSWLQVITSLNLFFGVDKLLWTDVLSLLVTLNASIVRWVCSLTLLTDRFVLQIVSSLISSSLSWSVFVIIFNRGLSKDPTRQQWLSLLASLCLNLLWEVNNRMIVNIAET
jgi:hypothetical protein